MESINSTGRGFAWHAVTLTTQFPLAPTMMQRKKYQVHLM